MIQMVAATAMEQLLIPLGTHAVLMIPTRRIVVPATTMTFHRKTCAVHAAGVLLILVSVC